MSPQKGCDSGPFTRCFMYPVASFPFSSLPFSLFSASSHSLPFFPSSALLPFYLLVCNFFSFSHLLVCLFFYPSPFIPFSFLPRLLSSFFLCLLFFPLTCHSSSYLYTPALPVSSLYSLFLLSFSLNVCLSFLFFSCLLPFFSLLSFITCLSVCPLSYLFLYIFFFSICLSLSLPLSVCLTFLSTFSTLSLPHFLLIFTPSWSTSRIASLYAPSTTFPTPTLPSPFPIPSLLFSPLFHRYSHRIWGRKALRLLSRLFFMFVFGVLVFVLQEWASVLLGV